jgi:hypothetical protein
MTPVAASVSGAASSAWSDAPVAQPLAFRKDTEEGFPVAGAVLLIALMLVAVSAWWYGRTRGGTPKRLHRLVGVLGGRPSPAAGELRIVETLQTLGGVRLLVVEWSGGRRVLVATSGAHAPVTLDTVQTPNPGSEAQP